MSLDSRWDSRWRSQSTVSTAATSDYGPAIHNQVLLSKVVVSLAGLPFTGHQRLEYVSDIGRGTSFTVTREIIDPQSDNPYFVAVKYLNIKNRSAEQVHRAYISIQREIQVLSHAPLRNHASLVRAIGYGWTQQSGQHADPYLVLDYSEHGTLDRYIKSRTIGELGLRELALDVAAGLDALHQNGILHGDIKPQNVLVFEVEYQPDHRNVAKICDFGNVLTEEEFCKTGRAAYGTPRYMAPELMFSDGITEPISFQTLCKADVFSFGILFWEILALGESDKERGTVLSDELDLDKRQKNFVASENRLAGIASRWVQENLVPRHKNPSGQLQMLFENFQSILRLCLHDEESERADMSRIVELLSKDMSERISQNVYESSRTHPMTTPLKNEVFSMNIFEYYRLKMAYDPAKDGPFPSYIASVTAKLRSTPASSNIRQLLTTEEQPPNSDSEPAVVGSQRQQTKPVTSDAALWRRSHTNTEPYPVREQTTNVYGYARAKLPSWTAQTEIFNAFQSLAQFDDSTSTVCDARLQLSACHLIGFGTVPNLDVSMQLLSSASENNSVARNLHLRVGKALAIERDFDNSSFQNFFTRSTKNFADFNSYYIAGQKASRAQIGQAIEQGTNYYVALQHIDSATNRPSLISFHDRSVRQLMTRPYTKWIRTDAVSEIRTQSQLLTLACQYGMYDTALALTQGMEKAVFIDGLPTPLHWLISFDVGQATSLAIALLCPKGADGVCSAVLNAPAEEPVQFPEYALELIGTPLHWAVRMANLPLVKLLLDLGADINAGCRHSRRPLGDPSYNRDHAVSPLDIAATFHLWDVVAFLIQHGANLISKDGTESHSPFHMVGQAAHPLARITIHGVDYRLALEQTIRVLLEGGVDINGFAELNEEPNCTPLRWALQYSQWEEYIVEALIRNGASEPDELEPQALPLAVLIAWSDYSRADSAWKLARAMPLIKREKIGSTDATGYNALHICVSSGNIRMANLLASSSISFDYEAPLEQEPFHTPLMLAVVAGRPEMVAWLVDKGASIETQHKSGTSLEMAVRLRRLNVIGELLKAGASTTFGPFDPESKLPKSSIVHAAVFGENKVMRKFSFMRMLLDAFPKLKSATFLDQRQRQNFFTPLHLAVTRGDHEAVRALLEAGADPTLTTSTDSLARQSTTVTTSGSALEITEKFIRLAKAGETSKDGQSWITDHTPGSKEVNQYLGALEEIRVLLLQAKRHRNGLIANNVEH